MTDDTISPPPISEVVEVECDVLRFRHPAGGAYSRRALTSCGHNWIHLLAWKMVPGVEWPDGTFDVEYHGIKIHCSQCGLIQSFGETP